MNISLPQSLEFFVDEQVASRGFVDPLEQVFRDIGRHPASGSQRYAHELDLPGLRCWLAKRDPHLSFHIESGDTIDIWRVLHAEHAISALLHAHDDPPT